MFDNSAVYKAALPLFTQAIESLEMESVRRYLVDARDLRPAFVRNRKIGVYPGPRIVNQFLLKEGFSQQAVTQSGILRRDVDGALVVPWLGDHGAPGVLVFRRMEKPTHVGEPKSKTRYAAIGDRDSLAPDGLREAAAAGVTRVVVVEGTFDFLQLRQQGEVDVVTPHSCALRPPHFARLKSAGVRQIVLAFDSDDAGRRATLSAIELAMSMVWDVRVAASLPSLVDADDFVRSHGVKAWRGLVARSTPGLVHYAQKLLAHYGGANPASARAACVSAAAQFHAKRRPDLSADDLYTDFWPVVAKTLGLSPAECRDAVASAYEAERARRSATPAARAHTA